MSVLAGVRVIELAHERCALVGKLLGDMGADVIVVEPIGGAPMRTFGPFVDDNPDSERSLSWWHYNTSKRSLALDWRRPEGRDALLALITDADILLEGEDPGIVAAAGLDNAALANKLTRLIHVSVTPFGPDGPRHDDQATDLTILASSGIVWNCGYDDHELPPIRPRGDHGYAIGGHYAAMSAVTALIQREMAGRGQRIDVSLNAAANVTTEMASYFWLVSQRTVHRQTGRHASEFNSMPTQVRCSDGIYVNTGVPPRTGKECETLLKWMGGLGYLDDFPEAIFLEMGAERAHLDFSKIGSDDEITAIFSAAREAMALVASKMAAKEFFVSAQEAGIAVGIIYAPEEAFEDAHFKTRGIQVGVEQPQLGRKIRHPGAPYAFEKTPWAIARAAPRLGEHSDEVLAETGIDPEPLRCAGVISSNRD